MFVAHGVVEYSLVARGIHKTAVTRVVISVFKADAAFDAFRSRWRHTGHTRRTSHRSDACSWRLLSYIYIYILFTICIIIITIIDETVTFITNLLLINNNNNNNIIIIFIIIIIIIIYYYYL